MKMDSTTHFNGFKFAVPYHFVQSPASGYYVDKTHTLHHFIEDHPSKDNAQRRKRSNLRMGRLLYTRFKKECFFDHQESERHLRVLSTQVKHDFFGADPITQKKLRSISNAFSLIKCQNEDHKKRKGRGFIPRVPACDNVAKFNFETHMGNIFEENHD